MLTAAGVEASQAPLIGHHQLTVGLLRANLLSPTRGLLSPARSLPEGTYPMFRYTDVPAFAAKTTRVTEPPLWKPCCATGRT